MVCPPRPSLFGSLVWYLMVYGVQCTSLDSKLQADTSKIVLPTVTTRLNSENNNKFISGNSHDHNLNAKDNIIPSNIGQSKKPSNGPDEKQKDKIVFSSSKDGDISNNKGYITTKGMAQNLFKAPNKVYLRQPIAAIDKSRSFDAQTDEVTTSRKDPEVDTQNSRLKGIQLPISYTEYTNGIDSPTIHAENDMTNHDSDIHTQDNTVRDIKNIAIMNDKRYLDDLGNSFVKKNMKSDKRYVDDLGSSFVKKSDFDWNDKRYIDDLGSSFVKKNVYNDKRYLDDLGSSFVKKYADYEKRYIDDLGSSFVKKNIKYGKRYIDDLGSAFVKRTPYNEKRYLDDLGSSFVKRNYLDDLGSSFVKKNVNTNKRYLDDLGSSFVKKNVNFRKRYIDDLGSSFVKKYANGNKRYLDDLGDSFVKKRFDYNKRYIDDLGSSFVKKNIISNKRYLDDLGSSFVKKNVNSNKRYIDDLGSSFVKKNIISNKRYLDDLGSSFVKKNVNSNKRYIDDLGSSFVKKNVNSNKRYIDDLGSSFVKKNVNSNKRYIDDLGSSFVKKNIISNKRYLDDLGSSFVKKNVNSNKRYIDDLGSSFVKKNIISNKRYLDDLGSSFVKKNVNSNKRYIDDLGSSFVKKNIISDKRYLDDLGSSFVKKNVNSNKRYIDDLGSSFVKKNINGNKRYLDDLGDSFVKKNVDSEKRYIEDLGSSFVKRKMNNIGVSPDGNLHEKGSGYEGQRFTSYKLFSDPSPANTEDMRITSVTSGELGRYPAASKTHNSNRDKRMMELTDDMLDGSRDSQQGLSKSRRKRQTLDFQSDMPFPTLESPAHFPPTFEQRSRASGIKSAVESLLSDILFYDNFTSNKGNWEPESQAYPGFKTKRYLDEIGEGFIKRSSIDVNDYRTNDGNEYESNFYPYKRYLDDIGSSAVFGKRDALRFNDRISDIPFDLRPVWPYFLEAERTLKNINKDYFSQLPSSGRSVIKRFNRFGGNGGLSTLRTFKPGRVTFQRFASQSDTASQRTNQRGSNRMLVYQATPSSSTSGSWSHRPWSSRINDLPGKKTLRSTIPPDTVPPTLMSAMLIPGGASRRRHHGNTKNYIRSAMQKFVRLQGQRSHDTNFGIHGNRFVKNNDDVEKNQRSDESETLNNLSMSLDELKSIKNDMNKYRFKNRNENLTNNGAGGSSSNDFHHEFSGRYHGYSTFKDKTKVGSEPAYDYFDSLAGSLLQT